MRKFSINVTSMIDIEIDETNDFWSRGSMQAFRDYFYNFHDIKDHVEHIAQLQARELIGYDNFVEGYGDITECGIKVSTEEVFIEELEELDED